MAGDRGALGQGLCRGPAGRAARQSGAHLLSAGRQVALPPCGLGQTPPGHGCPVAWASVYNGRPYF